MPLPDQSQPGQFLGDFQADGVHNDLSAPSAALGAKETVRPSPQQNKEQMGWMP